jgi:hypothetical protein
MSAARVYRPTPTVHGAGRLRSSVGGFGKYRTALQLGFDTAITGMLATYIRETLAARLSGLVRLCQSPRCCSMLRAGIARAGCPDLLQLAFREWKGHDKGCAFIIKPVTDPTTQAPSKIVRDP